MQLLTSKDKQDTKEHTRVPEAAGADPGGPTGRGTPEYAARGFHKHLLQKLNL